MGRYQHTQAFSPLLLLLPTYFTNSTEKKNNLVDGRKAEKGH